MAEKCTGCGAEVKYDAGSQSLKCPYCGALNEIADEGVVEDENETEDQTDENASTDGINYIIPLAVSQNALDLRVYQYIASCQDSPDDMLESINLTKRECFYVPAYSFDVDYEVQWSASFGYERTESRTEYVDGERQTVEETVTDWQPANGTLNGTLTIGAYAGDELDESDLNPAELVSQAITDNGFTEFNPSYAEGVRSEDFSLSEADAYASQQENIDAFIEGEVKDQAQGDDQKGWQWKPTKPLTYSGSSVYVPICHATFDYKGEEFNVWVDGAGSDEVRADKLPVDQGKRKDILLGFLPMGVAIVALGITSAIWHIFAWPALIVVVFLLIFAAMRRSSIYEYSKNIRDSLLMQMKASSTSVQNLSDDERATLAGAYQRPQKPMLAHTHLDMLILPLLCVFALAGASTPNYISKQIKAKQAQEVQVDDEPQPEEAPKKHKRSHKKD